MEWQLVSSSVPEPEPGHYLNVWVFATEQGLQVRIAEIPYDKPPGEGWKVHDTFSMSYTEVLALSYDVEKGRFGGPYGLPGDGLNFQLWKDRPR